MVGSFSTVKKGGVFRFKQSSKNRAFLSRDRWLFVIGTLFFPLLLLTFFYTSILNNRIVRKYEMFAIESSPCDISRLISIYRYITMGWFLRNSVATLQCWRTQPQSVKKPKWSMIFHSSNVCDLHSRQKWFGSWEITLLSSDHTNIFAHCISASFRMI